MPRHAPVSAEWFLDHAVPTVVTLTLTLTPRPGRNKSGSVGYDVKGGKFNVAVGGVEVPVYLGDRATVIGSRAPAPRVPAGWDSV